MEIFCLTAQKKSAAVTALGWLCLLLAVLSFFLSCGIGNILVLLLVILFAGLFVFLVFQSDYEYEASYFDGEFRFARIRHKSARKTLEHYSIEELVTIAPAGDRSVYRYENDSKVKVYDYTSKIKGVPYYDMIMQTQKGTFLYKVELDDAYLNAVSIKYASKIIRRKEK